MLSKETKNKIIFEMDKKDIKKSHQKLILKYIELNTEIFNYINIEELTYRILENFDGVSLNLSSFIYRDYGQYIPTTGKILLSPSLFLGKNKKYRESVFFHELDHCACSPIQIKQKYNEYKNEIKKKNKFLYRIIPDFILNEIFLNIHYDGPVSGVANLARKKGYTIQKISYGTKIENYLNEGITSLKQIIYSKKLKIPFHEKRDYFYGARMGVMCLANVIGFEKMFYLHFYNNLKKIEELYFSKTGMELEELIMKCMIYDKKNSNSKLKELIDYIEFVYKIPNK